MHALEQHLSLYIYCCVFIYTVSIVGVGSCGGYRLAIYVLVVVI